MPLRGSACAGVPPYGVFLSFGCVFLPRMLIADKVAKHQSPEHGARGPSLKPWARSAQDLSKSANPGQDRNTRPAGAILRGWFPWCFRCVGSLLAPRMQSNSVGLFWRFRFVVPRLVPRTTRPSSVGFLRVSVLWFSSSYRGSNPAWLGSSVFSSCGFSVGPADAIQLAWFPPCFRPVVSPLIPWKQSGLVGFLGVFALWFLL